MSKTRTSKVGAISKAQKAQNIILEKLTYILLQNIKYQRNWRGALWRKKFFFKSLTMSKKNSKGVPLGFHNIHSAAKHQKNAGEKFPKKMSRSAEEKLKGGNFSPLVLPGMVCYAEKQGKPFWSSSLGQMVQFDTIIFGRTFKNYFGQFVWIEKKSLQ